MVYKTYINTCLIIFLEHENLEEINGFFYSEFLFLLLFKTLNYWGKEQIYAVCRKYNGIIKRIFFKYNRKIPK